MNAGLTAVLVVASFLGACASSSPQAQAQAQVEAALALTPEHFASTATVKDDSLDTVAVISTEKGFQEKRGLLGIVWNDNFLRAAIDKKDGRTLIAVYQVVKYQGRGWNFFERVNYETPSGPESERLTVVNRDVDCTGYRYLGCTYVEQVTFGVDEKFLRVIADIYRPGLAVAWRFKFLPKSGNEHNDGMLPAEVAGFLQALDAYRSRKALPRPTDYQQKEISSADSAPFYTEGQRQASVGQVVRLIFEPGALHSEPTSDSPRTARVHKTDDLKVLEDRNEWLRVENVAGVTGWISRSWIASSH